ncbi:TonB-dependent receptor [Comamonadaceae bacterium OH2310_COT-174]|nr:TonB-dependent receptor [Comamonadaceae bacterium OH2310_COT-174]
MTKASFPLHALALLCASLGAQPLAQAQTQTQSIAGQDQASATATASTPELAEVSVSSRALDIPLEESATPVDLLDANDLQLRGSATLGDTLEGLPGVRNNHYGAGAGRPVIRGADGARVRILSDGSDVQDASTSSPDHAVAIEPMLAQEVEILRGPSTLLYGGGITGGVVNLRDGRVPTAMPDKGYEGQLQLRKDSSAREGTGAFALTGGRGPLALHVEGLKRSAGEYRVGSGWSSERVSGSHNATWYGSVGGALVHERGYLGLAYSRLRSQYGLPGHSHEYEDCHLHGNSLHCGSHGHAHDPRPAPPGCHWHGQHLHCTHGHDEDHIALVDMDTERWDLRGQWSEPLPGFSRARLRASVTDYRHDEIDHGEIGTTFKNQAHDARLELEHQPIALGAGRLRGLIGLQHSRREFSAVGNEAYVEPTNTSNRALFALEEYRLGDWRLELSGRYEWQNARLMGQRRSGSVRHHMGSLSAGASWQFAPGYVLAASASRSSRAPTAEELFAGGIHLATNTWERGNSRLKAEQSNNLDLTLRKNSGATRYELTAFYNRINHYIYAHTTDRHENFRLIDYRQHDAVFKGLEARISHQLNSQWRVGAYADMVRAHFVGAGARVPRQPAHRLGLNALWQSGPWSAGAEWYHSFAQNRITHYETRTPAYDMLNLHASWRQRMGAWGHYSLYAQLSNALDELAFNPISFVKEASPLRGRNLTLGLKLEF